MSAFINHSGAGCFKQQVLNFIRQTHDRLSFQFSYVFYRLENLLMTLTAVDIITACNMKPPQYNHMF